MNIQKKIFASLISTFTVAAVMTACSDSTTSAEAMDECDTLYGDYSCLADGKTDFSYGNDKLTDEKTEKEHLGINSDSKTEDSSPTDVSGVSKDKDSSGTDSKNDADSESESVNGSTSNDKNEGGSDAGNGSDSGNGSTSNDKNEGSSDAGNGSDSSNGSTSNDKNEGGSDAGNGSDSGNGSNSSTDGSSAGNNAESITSSSSSSAPAEESSSSAVAGTNTIVIDNNTATVGTKDMEQVSEEESKTLDDLKDALEKGEGSGDFTKAEKENFIYDTMDFENNIYYCFTGDDQWLRISFDNLKSSGLPFLWNDAAFGLQKKYELRFEDACAAIYVQRKN